MSKWWEEDVSDAGQGLFVDPTAAFQIATLPNQVVDNKAYEEEMARQFDEARAKRGGFMQNFMSSLGVVGKAVDGALSNIPGWGVTKNIAHATMIAPVDKVASGMYWLYSEAVSQPLSTALLVGGKADIYGPGQFFSGDAWSDAYHEAEHISPGQAFYNVNRTAFSDLGAEVGAKPYEELTPQQKKQMERFLYDTEYWRNRDGWVYTAGTGTIDFAANLFDPVGGAIVGGSRAVKAGRSIKVGSEAVEFAPTVQGRVAEKVVGGFMVKNPEEASQAKKVNEFFDWAEGKSPFEIQQHPIWGRGRRANPAKVELSEILSRSTRDEKPLILRFAMGDNTALQELSRDSQDLIATLGTAMDNRKLLAGHVWDADILDSYVQAQRAGAQLPVGVVAPGEQALYEAGAQAATAKRIQSNYTSKTWVNRAKKWQDGQVKAADADIAGLQARDDYFAKVLGDNLAKPIDEISPTASNLFGTTKQLYRMGGLSPRDAQKAADKVIKGETVSRKGREVQGGLASRIVQKGYYSMPLRVYQSFGDRLPEGFVNHNLDDAGDKVLAMLKQVPGLPQQARLDMIRTYSSAGDKLQRSAALKQIHTRVVDHMVSRHELSPDIAKFVDDITTDGWEKAMFELTGRSPQSSRFTAAKSSGGQYLDVIEDGYGRRVAPYAKTQLSASDPLLDVVQLDRILTRNKEHFGSIYRAGGSVRDNLRTFGDAFNGLWKASTLLRGGYALRAPSEEIVAGAVKFGLITAMSDAGKGGWNWMLNRPQFIKAITRQDGVHVLDPDVAMSAIDRGLPVQNVKVNKAYPMVQNKLSAERTRLRNMEQESRALTKKMMKLTDPNKIDDYTLRKQAILDDIEESKGIIQEFTDYSHEILRMSELPTRRRLGEGTFKYRGQEVPQAFNKDWEGVIPRDQITSENAMAAVYARAEAIDTQRIIKSGSWTTLNPGEANHMSSWVDALNKQFAQDGLIMKVMGDASLTEAKRWLKTPEGKNHLRSLTMQARDPEKLLQTITHTLDQYIPEGTGLRQKLLNGERVTEADLRQAIAKEDFPTVHGEELKAISTGNSTTRVIDDIIAKGFKALGTIPSDIMSRQPIYARAHSARMKQLIDQEMAYKAEIGASETIDVATMNKMMGKADILARKDLRQVVYDPQRTTATEALRFVAPFMSAHMDGLQRWAGLVAERPELFNTASKIYNAPVAAHLVTDQSGNLVDQDGYVNVRGKDGKIVERKFVDITERVLNLKIPGQTKNIKGIGEVETGGWPIGMNAINTILPGDPWWNPGSGPLVQIAGSKLSEYSPSTGDFLQWAKVLPYGPTDTLDAVLPKYMREAWVAWQGDDPDNVKFQQTMLQEYQRQAAEYANGGPAPDMKKVVENAKQFSYFKALYAFISPAQSKSTPLTGTPYQFFVDQYSNMKKADPQNADDSFLAAYGEDYYGFTASLNKSLGIASTAPAVETARMYQDIIAEHPDLAGFIVGPYNQGAFSSSANKVLQDMAFAGQRARSKMTAYEAISENQRELGWDWYKKLVGAVDASLFRAGYRSYQENGAEGFGALKQRIIQSIGTEYPSWEKDFSTTDKNAMPRRIQAMTKLAYDKRLTDDPLRTDIQMLQVYLGVRSQFKAALMTRPNKSIDNDPESKNADLARAWAIAQMTLAQQDTRFNDVFNRYLSNDKLQ